MSQFASLEAGRLAPYTPGEQPKGGLMIKLNTNESPFPPSPKAVKAVSRAELLKLNLYSDPTCSAVLGAVAGYYGLQTENVMAGNGSDELLAFAMRAFCGAERGAVFADITYGFYKVWAELLDVDAVTVPLREDFSVCLEDYASLPGTIFLANPNSPTGMAVPRAEIQRLLESNPDRVVVVDEAYVDFGAESCVPLLFRYDNLLVIQTLSKSRSLAGARLGLALGSPALISDLNRVKYSFNPYNVNRLTLTAGAAAMADTVYFEACCAAVRQTRAWTVGELEALGFSILPSCANFILAKSDRMPGRELYEKLRENGVLVRWFDTDRIRDYVRISIGSMEQMEALVDAVSALLDTL